MEKYEGYSVLITDNKGGRGTGILFYLEGSNFFYILTCAHVIYTAESVSIHILIPTTIDPKEEIITAVKSQFHFSPIDEPKVIGEQSIHTCDIAIIECALGNLSLEPTRYSIFPMTSRRRVVACGYPQGNGPLYYQQDKLSAIVEKILDEETYFLIRVDEGFLNAADREGEMQGFSGSPVWDEEMLDNHRYLFGGLIASGMGSNISRGRINVMNAKYVQSLMYQEFGILMKNRIPNVPENEVAPGYEGVIETQDQIDIRDSWIENERCKGQTYIDGLQLQKAILVSQRAIKNSEFQKCTDEQKYKIYTVLLSAYTLSCEYEICDQVIEEMHQAGIGSEKEDIIEAIRYFERLDYNKAEEFAEKALERNPYGNKEKVIMAAICVSKSMEADPSILAEFIDPNDQLLIKPKDEREEEFLYYILGLIFCNRFKELRRAIRCLNKSFQIGGNYIVLESLATAYYLYSLRDAYLEIGKDRVDPFKIDQDALGKGRDAFLRVLEAADEMWLKGTIRRVGPLMFKCFCFIQDNFRIYKHYHDLMKYFEFPNQDMLRDIQICYLGVATLREPVNLTEYTGLTEYDRKFFELANLLQTSLRMLDHGINIPVSIGELELLNIISEGEKRLRGLMDTQTDDYIGFDKIHQDFINLYGNGILRYGWQAISDVKRHFEAIVHPLGIEILALYINELEIDNFALSEQEYNRYFESKQDVISFNELCHFYIRHGKVEKTKELYDSVFDERKFLIENQSEYFYREYIHFYLEYGYDLSVPLRCYVEHHEEIKDYYLRLFFEMELEFASLTFNDPGYMLEKAKILFNEGIIDVQDYNQKCLIINMLNCRPQKAEEFVDSKHKSDQLRASKYERLLFVWKGYRVDPNVYWNSMQKWSLAKLNKIYEDEFWLRPAEKIMDKCNTRNRKLIVVDLWAIYYLQKIFRPDIMNRFEKVYITHHTISVALQEINQVNDDDIRRCLINFQNAGNVIIQSPSMKDQLDIRSSDFTYQEVHQALLLAKILGCPAFVGEFRYLIPDCLKDKIIRPNHYVELIRYMEDVVR